MSAITKTFNFPAPITTLAAFQEIFVPEVAAHCNYILRISTTKSKTKEVATALLKEIPQASLNITKLEIKYFNTMKTVQVCLYNGEESLVTNSFALSILS